MGRRNFHPAGIDLGDIKQIVDQAQKVSTGSTDIVGIILITRLADGTEQLLRDDLGEPDYGVQRRTQFVTHVGEKRVLGGVGRFGGFLSSNEVVLHRLAFGDVSEIAP